MSEKPFVELNNINKSFPGVKALTDVTINFYRGKVHVLLGENGAGKSTIIKVISGVYQADEGILKVDGQEEVFMNTRQSLAKGISVIHQELSVIPDLTVAENIFLGREPKIGKSGLIDKPKMNLDAKKLLESIGVKINPKEYIRKLNNGDKQMVEIARAISQNSSMVIMDEPTSSLSEHEVQALFRVINKLKSENVAIIYISHKLKEIAEIGDHITILRDGNVVKTVSLSEITESEMIALMVGRKMTQFYYKAENAIQNEVVLEVKNYTKAGQFEDVSFQLKKGEILGIAGLVGAGRTEVMRAVFGADKVDSGECIVFGQPVKFKSPKEAIKMGIGLIPEDRRNQGLLLEKSVKENTSLSSIYANSKKGFIDFRWEIDSTLDYIEKMRTKTPSERAIVKNLSGGNQQKVVIAKWLLAKAKILIMDEPTRGIDVNAKAEIYALMKKFVEDGGSIIVVSSELPEVIGVSNRIMIMREGKVSGILDAAEATEKDIMKYASIHAGN
ncbi:monosaccharide ABC transporter ATP-binding protein (CUT2 family) [Lachnotalea glycerini]|uniref:Monosaccharide ABC transporter ATP-binding protein (CUT2 family) n=1 Tax=Lachnotalea glycerini TaxID=1763509 RepID=A0A255I173_9FIRM|nr:sugar ABC transporter ATP-binding protein [Lachnotalea glycerini]PXV86633.1 monosaccharide ABC transporter ATP-binding protein (CUT2 family) [Lachnotalea glycerini]RDY32141.1 sugar ABC transporter ATP-binding protein [Lachnotalea glycerini]